MKSTQCLIVFVIFCSLLIQCTSNMIMYEEIKDYLILLEDVTEPLKILFAYAMPSDFECVQVYNDKTAFANSYLNDLHGVPSIPPIAYGKWDSRVGCKGFVVLAYGLLSVTNIVQHLPRWAEHRLVIIIPTPSEYRLKKFLASKTFLFGDAETLLVTSSNLTTGYQMGQPIRKFAYIDNMTKPWDVPVDGIADYEGRNISVLTRNCSLFSTIIPPTEEGGEYTLHGAEMEVFLSISETLNLTINWRKEVTMGEEQTSLFSSNKWYRDPIVQKGLNQTDVAFCGLIISSKKMKTSIDMSEPLAHMCLRFLIPRPKPIHAEWDGIFQPFGLGLWFAIAVALGFTTLVLQRVTIYTTKWIDTQGIEKYKGLGGSFIQLVSILVLGDVPRSYHAQGATRHVLTWWAMFTMILTTSFSSSLVSHLTTQYYSPKVDTVEKFVKYKYNWAYLDKPDFSEILNSENRWHIRWKNRAHKVKTVEEHLRLLKSGKQVLWGAQIFEGFVLPKDNFPKRGLKNFEAASQCFMEYFHGFAFREGTPFIVSFDKYIRVYRESGLIQKIIGKSHRLRARTKPYIFTVLQRTKTSLARVHGLTISHLIGIFQIWIGGILLSCIIFILEFCQRFHI